MSTHKMLDAAVKENELYDLLGRKQWPQKKEGLHSIQTGMFLSNVLLSSNNENKRASYIAPFEFNKSEFQVIASFKALFGLSLPELFSELSDHWDMKEHSLLLSSCFTALVHCGLKFLIHWPLQSLQILFQVLAWPTALVTYFNNEALKPSNGRGALILNVGGMAASWLITTPLQLFSVLANTLDYVRHILDGAISLGRIVINLGLDLLSKFLLCWTMEPKQVSQCFKNSLSAMSYAINDIAWNVFKLLPLAGICALTYFTGGFAQLGLNIPVFSSIHSISSLTVLHSTMTSTFSSLLGVAKFGAAVTALSLASQVMSAFLIKLRQSAIEPVNNPHKFQFAGRDNSQYICSHTLPHGLC